MYLAVARSLLECSACLEPLSVGPNHITLKDPKFASACVQRIGLENIRTCHSLLQSTEADFKAKKKPPQTLFFIKSEMDLTYFPNVPVADSCMYGPQA